MSPNIATKHNKDMDANLTKLLCASKTGSKHTRNSTVCFTLIRKKSL